MPDTDVPLTQQDRDRIIGEVNEIATARRIKNGTLAGILGCSPAVISQLKAGKYAGDGDKYLRGLAQWLRDAASRKEAPRAGFVLTSIAQRILAACDRAWRMPCIAQIVTPSGAGKTMALQEFCRRRGHRSAMVYAGEACANRTDLLREICDRMGLGAMGSTTWLYRAIREKLAGYYADGTGDPFCLVIDEATTLQPEALNLVRGLHDDPACRCAIVLADTWRMEEEFRRRAGRLAGGYEQLTSRCGAVYRLSAARLADVKNVRYEQDTKLVADAILLRLGRRGALGVRSYEYLHRIAQGPGALRAIEHRLHAVRDLAEDLGVSPAYTVAQLDYAATVVGAECEIPHKTHPFGGGGTGGESDGQTAELKVG
jgi:DNA transposition AAA+ family ATPase